MRKTLGGTGSGRLVRDCSCVRFDQVTSVTGAREPGGARVWRSADLGGLELFRATGLRFTFRPHAHEEFFIALTEAGRSASVYRGDTHAIGPGDIIVLNPEEGHAGGPQPGDSWAYRSLYLPPDLMCQVAGEFFPGTPAMPWFAADVVRDPRVAALLLRFHRLSELPGSSALHREAFLAEGLLLLASRHAGVLRQPRPPGREPRAVRAAREFLDAHAEDNVTLRDLARHAELTPSHLCRVFRQATGMAPHAYQLQVRVRRAKALLLAGHPIAQAAVEAGFWDQAHLTRHFKRTIGVTPARYIADLSEPTPWPMVR
jgi:AraC-like DNA-binding protein